MFTRLENLSNIVIYRLLWLEESNKLAEILNFFIYDSIKIIILLIIVTFFMNFINSYLPIEKIRKTLSKKNRFWFDYILASIFWAITPFCSCSSIPLFIWFVRWGIPLWVTFSFLITSPLINEVAVVMLLWIFWVRTTMIYTLSWIILWTIWGFILGRLKLEKYLTDFAKNIDIKNNRIISETTISLKSRINDVFKDSLSITKRILPYILIWVAIGGFIHWFIPTWFFEQFISKNNLIVVPLAVILWIPMYANATSVIPIIQSLIVKWIPLWTWLVFMMSVIWLSLPEFLILKKVMKTKLLLIFFWTIALFIIILWYFFNIFL